MLPWRRDTIIGLASSTKALTAATLLLVIDRGRIDLDAPLAHYWPQFAVHGKDIATVRELLGHRVGVVTTPRPFSTQDQYDQHPITEALAAAVPDWEPGTRHGYHAYTFGWLVSGLLQAVTGRSVFDLFSDEIATPYALDLTLALPSGDQSRVATVAPPKAPGCRRPTRPTQT